MTQESYSEDEVRLVDIVAVDEAHPGFGRQFVNGLSGLLVLLAAGIAVVLVVLWKSP